MTAFLSSMSFREKSLWVSLAIMIYLWIWYFGKVGGGIFEGAVDREATLSIFVAMTVIVVVLEVLSHIILAVLSPRDADPPSDERDRQIAWRAGSHSAWMLGAGVVTIAMIATFRELSAIAIVHCLILVLMAVQILSDALQILYYRRGF